MFQKSTVLLIVTLFALISGVQSVSHGISSSTYEGELNIESGPTVTTNVSGTYTVWEKKYDSGITRIWYSSTPPTYPHSQSKTTVYGFGTVTDKISGKVTVPAGGSVTRSNSENWTIGSWGIRANGTGAYTKARKTFYNYQTHIIGGSVYNRSSDEGTYTRTSDAEVKAYSYNYTTGTGWVKEATPSTAVSEGNSFSWTIDHEKRCPAPYCSNRTISEHDAHRITCSHCSEKYWNCYRNEASRHQGNNPPCSRNENTVSNNGGTVNNGGSTNSGCVNNTTYNWCSDTGSCTTRSRSGVPGECGHNYCCCAPSGSPIYNGNNGGGGGNSGGTGGSTNGGGDSGSAVTCGNCSARVSSSSAHQATCDLGHTYWTCGSQYSVNLHSVRHSNRTCVRCGTTFNSRTNGTCNSRWGTSYRWHWEG